MNDSKKRLQKEIFQMSTKLHFTYLEPDFSNIIDVYKNNLLLWYLNNSDEHYTTDNSVLEISNGIVKNPETIFVSKTKNGFPLSEVDFIDNELKRFEFIEIEKLSLIERKQFEFYTTFLSKHRTNISWDLKDYHKHYLETGRFGFPYLFTYKSNQFDEINQYLKNLKKRYDYIFCRLSLDKKIEFKNDFSDQLVKLKELQTQSKYKEIIQDMILRINDEYNHSDSIEKHKIKDYKNAILGYFDLTFNFLNDDKTRNTFYFGSQIQSFISDKNKYVKESNILNKNTRELLLFNHVISETLKNTFETFKGCYLYNIDERHYLNDINMEGFYLKENLKVLRSFSQSIEIEVLNGDIENAFVLKNYCVTQFKNMKSFLNSSLMIDIDKSPLKNEFDEVLNELEKSINIDELNLLNNLKKDVIELPQKRETNKPNEVTPDINNFIINVKNKKDFTKDLKNTFTIEKGKSIKAIINILIENKLLNIPDRKLRQFIDILRELFIQNIGTYSSINDAEKIKPFDEIFLSKIRDKLNPLIIKHKSN